MTDVVTLSPQRYSKRRVVVYIVCAYWSALAATLVSMTYALVVATGVTIVAGIAIAYETGRERGRRA